MFNPLGPDLMLCFNLAKLRSRFFPIPSMTVSRRPSVRTEQTIMSSNERNEAHRRGRGGYDDDTHRGRASPPSAGFPDKSKKNNIVRAWSRKPFVFPNGGVNGPNQCWAVRFVGATDVSRRPVYFSDGVMIDVMDSCVREEGEKDWADGADQNGMRRRCLIVYSTYEGASMACQHLTENWGDRFEVERIDLPELLRACKTSSIDVRVIHDAPGNSSFYPAFEQCCDDVRAALNALFPK